MSFSAYRTCSNCSAGNTATAARRLKPVVWLVISEFGVMPVIRLSEGALSSFKEAGGVSCIRLTAYKIARFITPRIGPTDGAKPRIYYITNLTGWQILIA